MIQQSPTEERAGCPFCGNSHVQLTSIRDGYEAWCKCGASMTAHNPDSRNKVIAKWNARAILASQAAQPAEADGVTASEKMWRIARFMGEQTEREAIVDWLKSMGDSKPHGTDWRTYYEIAEAIDEGRHEDAAAPKVPATDAGEVSDLRRQMTQFAQWCESVGGLDMAEIIADGGVTAGMMVSQEAKEQGRRARRALATPPAPNDDMRAAGIDAALSVIDTFIEASSLESVRLVAQQVRNTVSAALKENRRG